MDGLTTIDRTLRLLYVTCSRVQQSLALGLWSSDPTAALERIEDSDWFFDGSFKLFLSWIDRRPGLSFLARSRMAVAFAPRPGQLSPVMASILEQEPIAKRRYVAWLCRLERSAAAVFRQ